MQLHCLYAKVSQPHRQVFSMRIRLPVLQDLTYDGTGPPSPLPSGIVIRTPSPIPGPSTSTAQASQVTGGILATHFERTAQDLMLRRHFGMATTARTTVGNNESRYLAQLAVTVYQDCAATIPWVSLYQALQSESTYNFEHVNQMMLICDDMTQECFKAHI